MLATSATSAGRVVGRSLQGNSASTASITSGTTSAAVIADGVYAIGAPGAATWTTPTAMECSVLPTHATTGVVDLGLCKPRRAAEPQQYSVMQFTWDPRHIVEPARGRNLATFAMSSSVSGLLCPLADNNTSAWSAITYCLSKVWTSGSWSTIIALCSWR